MGCKLIETNQLYFGVVTPPLFLDKNYPNQKKVEHNRDNQIIFLKSSGVIN